MVVDDEPNMVRVLCALLEKEGYAVVSAKSAEEGFEAYKNVAPDLVLTDLIMPRDTGVALLRWIREKDFATPVIIVTGYATYLSVRDAMMSGADDFIDKGSGLVELLKPIKRCLAMSHTELELRHLKTSTPILAAENKKLKEQVEHFSKQPEDKSASKDLGKYKAICGAVAHGLKGEFLVIGNSTKSILELANTSPDIQGEL